MLGQQKYLNDRLLTATVKGDIADALHWLDAGAEIEAKDRQGNTPLLLAEIHGHTELVQDLLDRDADLWARDHLGETLMHLAARHNDTHMMRQLVEEELSFLEVRDNAGNPPLFSAVEGYQGRAWDAIRWLCDHRAEVNARDSVGQNLLHKPYWRSSTKQDQELISHFVELGLDPNGIALNGEPPLHHCVRAGDVDQVKILLRHGANPSLPTVGPGPMESALKEARFDPVAQREILQLLTEHGYCPLNPVESITCPQLHANIAPIEPDDPYLQTR